MCRRPVRREKIVADAAVAAAHEGSPDSQTNGHLRVMQAPVRDCRHRGHGALSGCGCRKCPDPDRADRELTSGSRGDCDLCYPNHLRARSRSEGRKSERPSSHRPTGQRMLRLTPVAHAPPRCRAAFGSGSHLPDLAAEPLFWNRQRIASIRLGPCFSDLAADQPDHASDEQGDNYRIQMMQDRTEPRIAVPPGPEGIAYIG